MATYPRKSTNSRWRRLQPAKALICLAAVLLTACGRPTPPLSPEQERKTFQLPPGFRAELVASEPQISDAISIAFDPAGRLYAIEMPDYPLDPRPLGRIKLLEDRDGDGRYEHSTVFAEELHFPEGVLPWRNGVLVACAPDLLYYEDRNGDGRADFRKVLMTGFATGNPQLRLNNPIYAIDNWIYAAHPRPPVPRRYVKEFGNTTSRITFPDRPEVAALEVRGMDLRFRPDKFQIERVSGNSQFGHSFDSWGNRFTVWNNDHVRHVVIGNQHLSRNPYLAIPSAMQPVSDHEAQAAVYPVTENPLVIHDTQAGRFTSACGLSVYTGGNLPGEFDNNSFTCEPVHNLVHRDILEPRGATFSAKRAYAKQEFLAAKDSWFRPVFTTTGPDGALYVVDYYHFTVEHPEFVPPQLLKQINFEKRHQLGRIWRIVHESSRPGRKPDLAAASSEQLVSELANANLWWRINAQRLLVERQDPSVVPALEKQAASPEARMHALWTLEGLASLRSELVVEAMSDPHPGVRWNAVRLAESRLTDPRIKAKLLSLAGDPDARVEFQLACALGSLPAREAMPSLQRIAARRLDDRWFQAAVLSSAADNPVAWFRFAAQTNGGEELLKRTASIVGARRKDAEIAELLKDARLAALDGLAEGLRQGSTGRLRLPLSQPLLLRLLDTAPPPVAKAALGVAAHLDPAPSPQLSALTRKASVEAFNASAPVAVRECAAGILGLDTSGKTAPLLSRLLSPSEPDEVQKTAASALSNLPAADVTRVFIDRWRSATSKVRDVLLAGFFADPKRLPALLAAVKSGTVQPWAIGPARTRQLMEHTDPSVRAQAREILSDPQSDRKGVYEKYLPAILMSGSPGSGRRIFEQACSECHKLDETGHELGPDLRSVSKRYKETLLADILMPNQNIEGGYEEYLIQTTDGRELTGILAKETPTTLTLRRRKGEEDTVLRSSVKEMRSLSVSPMPEDLETDITIPQMADLIAFIKSLQ